MLLLDAAGNAIKGVIKVLTRVTKMLLERLMGTLLHTSIVTLTSRVLPITLRNLRRFIYMRGQAANKGLTSDKKTIQCFRVITF